MRNKLLNDVLTTPTPPLMWHCLFVLPFEIEWPFYANNYVNAWTDKIWLGWPAKKKRPCEKCPEKDTWYNKMWLRRFREREFKYFETDFASNGAKGVLENGSCGVTSSCYLLPIVYLHRTQFDYDLESHEGDWWSTHFFPFLSSSPLPPLLWHKRAQGVSHCPLLIFEPSFF